MFLSTRDGGEVSRGAADGACSRRTRIRLLMIHIVIITM